MNSSRDAKVSPFKWIESRIILLLILNFFINSGQIYSLNASEIWICHAKKKKFNYVKYIQNYFNTINFHIIILSYKKKNYFSFLLVVKNKGLILKHTRKKRIYLMSRNFTWYINNKKFNNHEVIVYSWVNSLKPEQIKKKLSKLILKRKAHWSVG